MNNLVIILVAFMALWLAIEPARSQSLNRMEYVPSCLEQDWLSIEDDGPHKATVIYSNSVESCSDNVDMVLVSPNGIAVRVIIEVADAETIYLIPLDMNFMSFPPEAELMDGEKGSFTIMGGLS